MSEPNELADLNDIPEEFMEQILVLAKMCHSVNCAYLQAIRESFKPWESLEQDEKDRVIEQVAFIILNPDKSVSAWHDAWVAKMLVAGWKFGHKRSIKSKTHEQLKPFHHLPEMQQVKDSLYFNVVHQAVHGG